MKIKRTESGNRARSIFFERFNDIDFFVEDTAVENKKFYVSFLNSLLHPDFHISEVFPLGGKEAVIARAKSESSTRRKVVYLVDGDFDGIFSEKENVQGLVYVPAYCVENMLFDFDSIYEILDENDTVNHRGEIESKLELEAMLAEHEKDLVDLFSIYAVIKHFGIGEPTVSYSVHRFLSSKGDINRSALRARIVELFRSFCLMYGFEDFSRYFFAAKAFISQRREPFLSMVSGKHYLFPIVMKRARAIAKIKISDDVFKHRLALKVKDCPLSSLIKEQVADQ